MSIIPQKEYLNSEQTRILEESSYKYSNGFFVLFDIINSTARKRDEHNWIDQTQALYNSFSNFCNEIKNNREGHQFERVITKFIGDGLMAFFETSKKESSLTKDLPLFFIRFILSFIDYIQSKSEYLKNISLKSVLTYLEDVRIVDPSRENTKNDIQRNITNTDVLGDGIDFSFRLEKFGDSGHIVINKSLAESIKNQRQNIELLAQLNHEVIWCYKKIKGLGNNTQPFALLVNLAKLEESYRSKSPSSFEENVYLELFQWYISKMQKISTIPSNIEQEMNKLKN